MRGGHALVEAGHRVFYARTSDLVQKLQVARRNPVLEAALAKLDRFDRIILDDISRQIRWRCSLGYDGSRRCSAAGRKNR